MGVLLVKVVGQYYKRVQNGKIAANYEATFKIPDTTPPDRLLWTVQRQLINKHLQKLDAASAGFRTCAIVDVQRPGAEVSTEVDVLKKPIDKMTKDELSQFCLLKNLNMNIDGYGNILEARQAVKDRLDDVEFARAKEQKEKAKKEQEEKERRELEELNELPLDEPPRVLGAEGSVTQPLPQEDIFDEGPAAVPGAEGAHPAVNTDPNLTGKPGGDQGEPAKETKAPASGKEEIE